MRKLGSGAYTVVSDKSKSLQNRDLFLLGEFDTFNLTLSKLLNIIFYLLLGLLLEMTYDVMVTYNTLIT